MSQNLADGLRADRAPGTVGAARRRRDRRLRAFLKHERVTVAMNLATIQHPSFMKSAVVDAGVQVGSPLAPVAEYVAPAPAVSFVVPSQQLRPAYTTATVATGVSLDVSGMVHPQFSSTAVEVSSSQVVGSLPLGEVSAATGVTLDYTGLVSPLFSSTAVEVSASHVVGSLPLGEVFAAPVFHPVHQEQLAGGDTTENIANFPAVQEQVLVQAILRLVGSSPVDEFTGVVGSLPPAEEFTEPVFTAFHQEQLVGGDTTVNIAVSPVVLEQGVVGSLPPAEEFTVPVFTAFHQEQFSAGETIENISVFPVVQEQVRAATVGYVAAAGPLLVPPVLGGGDTLDDATVSLLERQELQEMVAAAKRREEVRLEREEAKAVREVLLQKERKMARIDRLVDAGRPVPADDLAEWQAWHAPDHTAPSLSSSGKRRKRKKRRRRRTGGRGLVYVGEVFLQASRWMSHQSCELVTLAASYSTNAVLTQVACDLMIESSVV